MTGQCRRWTDVLFIKTSSLGDVIHHMPAVTEARQRLPDARFAWVVEEAFAPLVGLHPAVDGSFRWRRGAGAAQFLKRATWKEIAAFRRLLARRPLRQGDRHAGPCPLGDDRARGAGRAPRLRCAEHQGAVRVAILRCEAQASRARLHAVERNRVLTGLALGYAPVKAIGLRPECCDEARGALCDPSARHLTRLEGMAGRMLDRTRALAAHKGL